MPQLPDIGSGARPLPQPGSNVGVLPSETGLEMVPAKLTGQSGDEAFSSGLKVLEGQQHELKAQYAQAQADARLAAAEAKAEERARLAEQKQLLADQRRTAGLRAMTDYGNDVADAHQAITQGLKGGTIKPEAAFQQFDQFTKSLDEKYTKDVAPDVLEPVRISMDNAARDARRRLGDSVESAVRDQVRSNLGATLEGLQRRAITDLPGAQGAARAVIEEEGLRSGMTKAQIQATLQTFNETTTFNFLASQVNTATNSGAALQPWQKLLTDPKQYPDLDPEKRRILLNQIGNEMERRQIRAERAQERYLNNLGREMDGMWRRSMQGTNPTVEGLAAMAKSVRGTPYEKDFGAFVSGLDEQRKFGLLPPAQMNAIIVAGQASLSRTGSDTDAENVLLNRQRQIFKHTVEELTSNPLGYNARTAGVDIPAVDWQKLDEKSAVALKQRQTIVSTLSGRMGSPQLVLMPQEATTLAASMKDMNADQRVQTLKFLSNTLGPTSGAYRDTLLKLGENAPVTAFAGEIAGRQARKPGFFSSSLIDGTRVAAEITAGEDLLARAGRNEGRGTPLPPIKEQEFRLAFNTATKGVFGANDQERARTYYNTAKALYAKRSLDDHDYSGVVNPSRVSKAFDDLTGGGVVNWGGSPVLKPFEMTENDFRSAVRAQFARAVADGRARVDPAYIDGAQLFKLRGSRYIVQSGSTILPDAKTGGQLVIDLDAPLPQTVTIPRPGYQSGAYHTLRDK